MSDEGGIGLEGLLGLEVLENAADVVSVLKERPAKVKREKFEREKLSDDENGSDNERSSNKKRRKKLQKKKKDNNTNGGPADDEPGKFVRLKQPADKNVPKKAKKGKAAKVAKSIESSEPSPDEDKVTVNDLIVSIAIGSTRNRIYRLEWAFKIGCFLYTFHRDGMDLV